MTLMETLKNVRFYADGGEIKAFTGYLRFKHASPAAGTWLELSDGLNTSPRGVLNVVRLNSPMETVCQSKVRWG